MIVCMKHTSKNLLGDGGETNRQGKKFCVQGKETFQDGQPGAEKRYIRHKLGIQRRKRDNTGNGKFYEWKST